MHVVDGHASCEQGAERSLDFTAQGYTRLLALDAEQESLC